ncbi:MAG: patatin-like phospholipase family protein [Fibrobacteres bacterium]|nr:patatin-like phospholipase family protein [Fibrobacterota bacterium]
MLISPGRQPARNALCGFIFAALTLGLLSPAFAFVFLDTSGPHKASKGDSASRQESPKPPEALPPATASPGSTPPVPAVGGKPESPEAGRDSLSALPQAAPANRTARTPDHYGNVLFLSADSKLVYAYLGVLKALEEFGLEPDAVLAESKAVVVGAAWALGYSSAATEKELMRRPLEGYLRPFPTRDRGAERTFYPPGPDPMQWEVPLGLQSLQTPGSRWSDVTMGETGEYLHLSWMVAQLTHDAPGGPVEDLAETPRRLAVQVSDLTSDKEAVLTDGNLQNIVKASLLPAGVVRQRQRLWPFASGSLLSGNAVMSDKLPFSCDRIILIQPGHRLRPSSLEGGSVSWTDSLNLRTKRRIPAPGVGGEASAGQARERMVIELEPEGEFDPEETDPIRWMNLGYTSALRSMDILQSVLTHKKDTPPSGPKPGGEERLGLNRLSVNPLASGGRELLLDIVRTSDRNPEDSSGEGAIAALVESGFYTDLDLEWSRGGPEEKASLIFDAKEKSKIDFRAGYNFTFTGEELPDRPPEVYGGVAWSEPFYIPFEAEAGLLLGGHRPGYQGRFMIAPVFPLHLEIGLTRTNWNELYPNFVPPKGARYQGPWAFRLDRTLSELFLTIFPFPSAYLRTAVQKHEMSVPDEGEPSFLSTDFQETAFLGLGKRDPGGFYPHALRLRFRNYNRVNTVGQVKYPFSSLESRLRFTLGDFRLSDQYFWSDQETRDFGLYDMIEAGRIDAFTFQDEYFFTFLRSRSFRDVKLEYGPTFGKAGLRLIAGAYRNYGGTFFPEQAELGSFGGQEIPFRFHWEVQAGYVTPLGTLRAGLGSVEDDAPIYFLRLGSGFELGFDKAE